MNMQQLPLSLRLNPSVSFENYIPGPNQAVLTILQQLIQHTQDTSSVYLWGAAGTGKTHLLQAALHYTHQHGIPSAYVPLRQVCEARVEVLEGIEEMDLVCIDDVDAIAGNVEWERAVFRMFNQLRDTGKIQILSGHAVPQQLGLHIPDLVSRLSWGGVFALQPLDEPTTVQVLQQHAQDRGLTLPHKVALHLIKCAQRDMTTLIGWLQQLDYASLSAKRRLTVPFVNTLLDTLNPPHLNKSAESTGK